ncbi:hypothetical protein BDF14DRAFT_1800760 [Spinellus fusiger]|nr:hypothetical protein BDF14DRAFT_1800760 [Spinellus fusiger]
MSAKRPHGNNGAPPNKKSKKNIFSLQAGMTGVMVTCSLNKEALAVKEVLDVFNQYADVLYPMESANSGGEEDGEEDIEASIAREVAALKNSSRSSRFYNVSTGTTCLVFIRTVSPVEPVSFVHHILTDMNATQSQKTRHVSRLLPVEKTCKANLPEMEALAQEVVFPKFNTPDKDGKIIPRTFAIVARVRNCSKINRMEVITKIAAIAGPEHSVDLTRPELTVIVEIIQNICLMSVVEDFFKLKKYNIESLLGVNDAGIVKPIKEKREDLAVKEDEVSVTEATHQEVFRI